MMALATLPKYRAISFRGWPFFVPGLLVSSTQEGDTMTNLDVRKQDELNDCLSDSITVANLLVDGSNEADPIDPGTVSWAGHMVGERLRKVRELLSEGGAS